MVGSCVIQNAGENHLWSLASKADLTAFYVKVGLVGTCTTRKMKCCTEFYEEMCAFYQYSGAINSGYLNSMASVIFQFRMH